MCVAEDVKEAYCVGERLRVGEVKSTVRKEMRGELERRREADSSRPRSSWFWSWRVEAEGERLRHVM